MSNLSKFKILVILFGLMLFSCQENTDLTSEVIESIESRIEYGINPSIAIGIVDQNGTRFYNFGKVSKNGTEVDKHTIYEIGSITKTFTGILLAKQVVESQVALDDPIKRYLPVDVNVPVIWSSDEITLGSLSDHTSGLPRMPDNFTPADHRNPYIDYSINQLYEFINNYTPKRRVGFVYEYSNVGQGLLGHILALNSGLSYESLMIRDIALPLDMQETKMTFSNRMKQNLATGHCFGFEVDNWDIPALAGAGGLRSSTSDMIKYISANLGFIDTQLIKAMNLSHQVRHHKAGNTRIGLGWHIMKGAEGDIIYHSGGTGGYRSFAGFVKESNQGVVLLTNSTADVGDIGFHLLDADYEIKPIKQSFAIAIKMKSTRMDRIQYEVFQKNKRRALAKL